MKTLEKSEKDVELESLYKWCVNTTYEFHDDAEKRKAAVGAYCDASIFALETLPLREKGGCPEANALGYWLSNLRADGGGSVADIKSVSELIALYGVLKNNGARIFPNCGLRNFVYLLDFNKEDIDAAYVRRVKEKLEPVFRCKKEPVSYPPVPSGIGDK